MHFAREWATLFGAEIFLLHVIESPTVVGNFGVAPVGTVLRDYAGHAKATLTELARQKFPASISVATMVRKGKPFDQIAIVAQQMHADIIIIATHGHGGLKRVLLGSTAELVARHAPCPVLILRRRSNRMPGSNQPRR
jgi:nucleotide-binding universal stress UspA family protein